MMPKANEKVEKCLAYAADLRRRANAAEDPLSKAELQEMEVQWLDIAESYKVAEQAGRHLDDLRARRSTTKERLGARGNAIRSPSQDVVVSARPLLRDCLGVLVQAAVEHADGNARAAFYLANAAESELRHVVGMTPAYARCVDGFSIGPDSLACGLAVAKRQSVITADVSEEPRWEQWLWLARKFDYRACWSFPVATSSGKALGSFAIYYPEPREATPRDLDIAALLTRTAATIISRG